MRSPGHGNDRSPREVTSLHAPPARPGKPAGRELENWRIQQILDCGRDPFIEVDADGCIAEWSKAAEAILGWRRDEMVGRPVRQAVTAQFSEFVEQGLELLRASSLRAAEAVPVLAPVLMEDVQWRRREGRPLTAATTVFATGRSGSVSVGAFLHVPDEVTAGTDGIARGRLHDALTGLASRVLFSRRLSLAIDRLHHRAGSVAVVVLNLDRFNAINDALGHDLGDEVLVTVASRLQQARQGDRPLLARLGGDEFLALFERPGPFAGREAERFAAQALAALVEPFSLGGEEIYLTASVGISATSDPQASASTLLSNAGVAMHDAKAASGGGLRVFGEAMRRQVVERLTTERALHQALARHELAVFYQPVVDLQREVAVAVEALVRWQHPEHGLMTPDRFIPVAETSGLIIPMGSWVLWEACHQLRTWRSHGGAFLPEMVEVNLSARQIDDPHLIGAVESALITTGLSPEHLTLEITESALMRDASSALDVLRALKGIGVSVAIDDFGTGYSSLSYLQRFPLDILKIDKSFTDGLETDQGAEIVAAVVNLAHALGLEVIAEGVETEGQARVLRDLGCELAQGYLFARPLPAADVVAWPLAGVPRA